MQISFFSIIKKILLIALAGLAAAYLFWPRSQMGPPVQVQSLIHPGYLPAMTYPEDSLLEAILANKENLPLLQTDSLLGQIPDSNQVWIKARVYRAWFQLERRAAGQAMNLLQVPLPDSSWQWPASRHWYLALARTQSGKLSEALRVLDSVPARFSPEKDSLIQILIRNKNEN
ncbi:MAG: hypothetical protein R3B47_11305 [Bacteroidia bacterium]